MEWRRMSRTLPAVHLLAYEAVFGSYDVGKRAYRGRMLARATSGTFSDIEII